MEEIGMCYNKELRPNQEKFMNKSNEREEKSRKKIKED